MLGLAYHNLGNHAQALEYYQKALAMQQALHEGEHHADVAATLRSIGLAYERLGKDTEALEYHQQALAMYQALHEGEHHADVAAALRSVGLAHQNLSKYTEALEYYQKALAMRKGLYEEENHAQVALVLKDVGDAYKGLGQHAQALEYYQQALAMQQALHEGEHHDDVAAALRSVGLAHQNLGDHAQALEYHQQALAMYQALHEGEHHADVAAALRSVGLAHQNLGLRNYYKDPTFACVPSLFDGQPPKHVKDLECQLMLFEQKLVKQDKAKEAAGGQEDHIAQHQERRLEWVKTPIALQDLFKKRSTKPGDPEKELQQILLTGDPGTGKTALSRQLAYQWSEGLWGQEFHTLYLLPVISLQQIEYDGTHYNRENTLATAIVNTCFAHDLPTTEAEYTSLRDHIDQELKKATTLVILDGLDERAGASEEILRQAQAGSHKLLMLSRLYGIETERRTVEVEVEHVGFNPEQLERYVRQEVSDGKLAEALLGYIYKHENIRSIAHVPVNLQILCALWQGEEYRLSEEELQQGSLAGLYDRFTGYIWKRYVTERKLPDRDADKVALFNALGQIALQALEQGQALIDFKLVDDVLERAAFDGGLKARLRAVGFLLLKYVDKDAVEPRYEFPHLTFQEYFAGRALAQEQEWGSDFLSAHKYESQYVRTLSFMAGEVSRVKRASGIEQLLGLLEQEKEVVGLQHLRLQLQVLQEWLCVAGKDAADELAELERGSQVLASLEEWFVRAFAHVRLEGYRDAYLPGYRLLALLKSSLQTFGSITIHAPGLLELFKETAQGPYGAVRLAAVDSLGGSMASVDDKARVMLQAMADDRNESREIQQAARKALREAKGAEATQDEAVAGGGTAQGSLGGATGSASQSPEDLLAQLRQAAKDAKDEDDKALRSARGSLVQAVAAATQEEFGALLDLLLPAAQDWHGSVRAAALEALLKAPLDTLLVFYWSKPDARLIPYITPRLYHTPLVIAQSVRSAPQRVSLYAAAGQAREWRQPQGVLADFERYVQDAVSQLSQVESRLSARVDKSVWEQYFGAIGEEPALPDDLEEILDSPCPFWHGRQVRDTHLLALIPSHVAGKPLTLNYLGELIQSPKGGGHGTKYRNYWNAAREALGRQSPESSYWVLMTKDVLEGSRNKSYQDQCALVARHQGYTVPGALEAAVVMLLHHVRKGERLYSDNPDTYTRCREKDKNGDPVVVGGFSSVGFNVSYDSSDDHNGVAGLRKFGAATLSSFGDSVLDASVWARYFGAVDSSPSLWARYFGAVDSSPSPPSGIDQILNSPCPFWEGKQVRDTHLLVLIPSYVAGQPLTLDYLGQLIQRPQGGGHATKYDFYPSYTRSAIGGQSPSSSYWVLMTRDVLPGSRWESYQEQCALVADHAKRTGLGYEVPGALEAAVVMLLHHVRSGERLYSDSPLTWTRCRDKDTDGDPVVVGAFLRGASTSTSAALAAAATSALLASGSLGQLVPLR